MSSIFSANAVFTYSKTFFPSTKTSPNLKASFWLWGTGPLQAAAAQNMNYTSAEEVEGKIKVAIRDGQSIREYGNWADSISRL